MFPIQRGFSFSRPGHLAGESLDHTLFHKNQCKERREGTLTTYTPIFIGLTVGVILLVGALNFFPALALGPIAEQLAPISTLTH